MASDYTHSTSSSAWTEAMEQKMADLATFADGLVHDLRNPLNVIRSNLYLLRQRLAPDDDRALRSVNRMDDQVTAALHLLEGVQAFYRADRPALQRVDPNEVVGKVAEGMEAPEGCRIETALAEGLPLVQADPQLLEVALRALLRNAIDAMPGGGTIRVVTQVTDGRLQIGVEDAGTGIAEEILPRVLEPLFTTRKSRSGLGLALAAKIARAHGGTFCLYTTPGSGSLALVDVPLGS